MYFIRIPKRAPVVILSTILISTAAPQMKPYTAQQLTENNVPVVRLTDSARGIEVSVVPSIGNRGYEMKARGAGQIEPAGRGI